MAKKLNGLSKFFLSIVGLSVDKLFDMGVDGLNKLLDQGWAENPELLESGIKGAYPIIDVVFEKHVKDTKSKVDDKFVEELKQVLETFAATHGFELENLDDD